MSSDRLFKLNTKKARVEYDIQELEALLGKKNLDLAVTIKELENVKNRNIGVFTQ